MQRTGRRAFDSGKRPAATDGDHDWWVVSGARAHASRHSSSRTNGARGGSSVGSCSWIGPTRDGQRTELGAGYSLLQMTKLRRPARTTWLRVRRAVATVSPGRRDGAARRCPRPLETEVRVLPLSSARQRGALLVDGCVLRWRECGPRPPCCGQKACAARLLDLRQPSIDLQVEARDELLSSDARNRTRSELVGRPIRPSGVLSANVAVALRPASWW